MIPGATQRDIRYMDDAGRLLLARLRNGQEVMFEGVRVIGVPVEHSDEHCGDQWPCWNTNIEPGDTYMAGRNTGPHLLTCKAVHADRAARHSGWIISTEAVYPFDIGECVKVKILLD